MPYKDPEKRKATQRAWKLKNREKLLAKKREYNARHPEVARANRQANREQRKARRKEWARRNPESVKKYKYKSTYGISTEQRDALFVSQGSCCAMCRSPESGKGGWHTDHDHGTGLVRGVLCARCNVTLGRVGDTLEGAQAWFARAFAYLSAPPGTNARRPRSAEVPGHL